MLTEHDEYDAPSNARQTDAIDLDTLEKDLERAVSIMAKLDTQNRILDKCVKFTTTLRYLLQGLKTRESIPRRGREDFGADMAAEGSRSGMNDGVDMGTPSHGGTLNMDGDMVSSMMDMMPPDFQFQDIGFGNEDLFKSPGFIDNFTRQGDLFW